MEDTVRRDGRGRFVRGVSGNPAGRPAGLMSEAQRIAALLLGGEAGALTRKAIELALEGDLAALRLCLDRIIAPQREQPAAFALPEPLGPQPKAPQHNAPATDDAAAAMAALIRAAAAGEVTPRAAAELARVLEAQARVAVMMQHQQAERVAARHAEIAPRLELRVCVVMAHQARDVYAVGARLDDRLKYLCEKMFPIGEAASQTLATIPDTPELCAADAAFLTEHPLPLVRAPAHPLGSDMLEAYHAVSEWLGSPDKLQWYDDHLAALAPATPAATPSTHAGNVT